MEKAILPVSQLHDTVSSVVETSREIRLQQALKLNMTRRREQKKKVTISKNSEVTEIDTNTL